MSSERDFDQIARAWLDLMPDEAPDRTIDAVLQAVATTPQVIRPTAVKRRLLTMNRFVSAGIAAAILVAAGTFLVITRPTTPGIGSPSQPPLASPLTSPSASSLAADLRSTWIGVANTNPVLSNGAGPVSLSIGQLGMEIDASNFGPGHGYASAASQTGPNRFEVVLDQAGGGCAAGARGIYAWTLTPDRSLLTLDAVSDDCAGRPLVFARQWARSLVGPTTVGAGYVDSIDPMFRVTLPDDSYQTRTLADFVEIASSGELSLMVFKNPQPFVDPCSDSEERVPYQPGAAAFVDHFRKDDAFIVGNSTSLKIDGHNAVHVVIGGKDNYARCPGRDLYEYTPKACVCHFIVGPGGADSMYLVEIGPDTYMFIVSPLGTPSEQAVIDSIRIPVELPAQ